MDYVSLRENTLLGIGHPLLDLLVYVDCDFLRKYNLKKNTSVAATEEQRPLIKDIIENYDPIFLVGGGIYNALSATQWIVQKPKIAASIGCIGNDRYAKLIEDKASKLEFDIRLEKLQSKTTSFCVVLITGDHRTLVTSVGTSNYYSEEHIQKIWPYIENAQFFYIMGFSLAQNFDFIMKVARYSNENDKKLVMNLSAEYICKNYTKELMTVFPYIDVIFGNELELLALATALNWKSNNFKDICLKISNLPKQNEKTIRLCIITRTEKPVICSFLDVVKEFPVLPIPQEKIVDTNGAGDAFVGGFLAQFITGRDIDECITCGLYAASISIQHIGCNFDDKNNKN